MAQNTKIEYLYRDIANWKQYGEAIFRGEITEEEKNAILDNLHEGNFFIPSQVGLNSLQEGMPKESKDMNHIWHDLDADDIKLTSEEPTQAKTITEFAQLFNNIQWKH